MEKIAILNLNSDSIKMQFVNVNKNKSFAPYKSICMPINLTKDFYGDYFIKPNVIKEIMSILKVYKKMADKEEIKTVMSHPQALGQCSEYINVNGYVKKEAILKHK